MMKRFAAVALLLLAILSPGGWLEACGDKFLVASRGTRYQRAPLARRPASILIYSSASSRPSGRGGEEIEGLLRKSGYTPTTVGTASELSRALSRGGWDVVVLVNPSAEEWKQSRNAYPLVLKAPARSQAVLEAVDQALAAHRRTAARAGQPAI